MLKGYLVLLLKLILRVFGPALIVSTYMDDLLFLLGLTGMLFASVAALRQEEVKRMIAYSSSAQISYIFLALGLGSEAGWTAACYQILAHAMTKDVYKRQTQSQYSTRLVQLAGRSFYQVINQKLGGYAP